MFAIGTWLCEVGRPVDLDLNDTCEVSGVGSAVVKPYFLFLIACLALFLVGLGVRHWLCAPWCQNLLLGMALGGTCVVKGTGKAIIAG